MKKIFLLNVLLLFCLSLNAQIFNKNLSEQDKTVLNDGKILIKNINYAKNMSINKGNGPLCDQLIETIRDFSPKYLAEVIQYKKFEGNEDLPERLIKILNNVPDYAGIPYYSERNEKWFDLYSSATIKDQTDTEDKTIIHADIEMEPFGILNEELIIKKTNDCVLYTGENLNKVSYYGKMDCFGPHKMKICIYLFNDGENWILYGIGGVNAPRVPFLTERIETSFINRIKTFCNYIFEKL